ncbi:MAG: hypothetical protein MRERV_79c007 [Mycoplasmataceae bacterium RV_VA103A]|nr:MAG: hypothetical protein MRERV_79c007 [Mycoplasmataceae bacterium RV_VA103A]
MRWSNSTSRTLCFVVNSFKRKAKKWQLCWWESWFFGIFWSLLSQKRRTLN